MQFSLHVELPLRLRPERPLSDEDLIRFCAVNEAVRIEKDANGELILMSPTGSGSGETNSELNYQLRHFARQTGAGAVFDSNAGFTLPDQSMRSPDASFITWPRWNALSKSDQERFAPICPDFIIELRSPSDKLADLRDKMHLWIGNGAKLAWLIDPQRKAVEIYRPDRKPEIVEGASAVDGEGPVAGFALDLGRLWT